MKKLIVRFAAILALAVPVMASAAGAGPNAYGNFGSDGGFFGDSDTKAFTFNDSYTFDLIPGAGYWSVTSILAKSTGISNFTIGLFQNGVEINETPTSNSTTLGPGVTQLVWTEVFPSLAGGLYTLDFSGSFLKNGGQYGGSFLVTPVPETSTWLAMVVGLALMGSVTLRQRKFRI